jgi:predicted ester cyclase
MGNSSQCRRSAPLVLLAALVGCGARPLVSDKYQTEQPASAPAEFDYQRYIDRVYNAHDPDAVAQFFTSDVIVHSVAPDVEGGQGLEYLKQLARNLITAFPDVRLTVEELVAEGDRLAARVSVEGTHQGEFLGIKPTGRKIKVANFAT